MNKELQVALFIFISLSSFTFFNLVAAQTTSTVPIYYITVKVDSDSPLILHFYFETPTIKFEYVMDKEITSEEINTFVKEKGLDDLEGLRIRNFLYKYANNLFREISIKKAKIEGILKYSNKKGEDSSSNFNLISGNFSYPRLTIPYIGLAGYFFKTSEENFLMSSSKINGNDKYVFVDFDGTFVINTLIVPPMGTPGNVKNYLVIEPANELILHYNKDMDFTIKNCFGDPCMTLTYVPTRIFYYDFFSITPESLKDFQRDYDKMKIGGEGLWDPVEIMSFNKEVSLKRKDNYCILRGTFLLKTSYTKENGAFVPMFYEINKGGYDICKREVVDSSPTKTGAVFGIQKDSYFVLNLENGKIYANLRNIKDINAKEMDFNYNDFSLKSSDKGTVASLYNAQIILPKTEYARSLIVV
ncbi:MAG: hypothetical protein N3G19_01890 [Candidatus Pacearchaeota archaeon]|nr:hypothetical protein [Candidatus Pacearchaeota archaeon]